MADQSDAGSVGIFSWWTNQTQEATFAVHGHGVVRVAPHCDVSSTGGHVRIYTAHAHVYHGACEDHNSDANHLVYIPVERVPITIPAVPKSLVTVRYDRMSEIIHQIISERWMKNS
eukprot:1194407-Prorocentrum_minimum.AAC.1